MIAAVNGMAVGGGFELALSCDLILAAEHARFALPEIAAGTLADAATIKLPRRIPHHVAMDLLLTGRWMERPRPRRWGLVNEILPGRPPAAARARARPAARRRPAAGVRRDQGDAAPDRGPAVPGGHGPGHQKRLPTVKRLYESEDQLEGARAFAEKRKPVWRGRRSLPTCDLQG